nr:hypothetical protein [Tanacetum cinerariifolium]
ERAAKAQNWKLPVCYDDDDDEERSDSLYDNIISGLPPFSAITPNEPVLFIEEPDNSLSMGDEHLDTILATESDEVIKSGVENLIPIPSESEGIPDHMYDVPFHDNSPPLDVLKDQFKDFSESNDEFSSTDDDSFSFDKIDYVEASPPDSELVSSEVMEIVIPETNNFDNSLPEFTTFSNVLFDAEYESDSNDDQSCSDEDVLEKIISKPLFEEEIIPMKIDLYPDNVESDLLESLRTHDSSLLISSKIDSLLDEFVGELTLLKSISLGIDETDKTVKKLKRNLKKLLLSSACRLAFILLQKPFVLDNLLDTSAQQSESSSSITSSPDPKIIALKAKMAKINKNLMRVLQANQQVKAVTPNCETCGGPHSYTDCPATVGQTQNVYAARAYQGGFNQNQNRNNQNQNFQNQNKNHGIPQRNNQGRNQFFQGASHGLNPPPSYQASAYQSLGYQASVHQPPIPQPQVVTANEFTNFMKANDAILKNMQTNTTSLTNFNLELKNMFGQFMKINTASSSGSGTLPSNTITNPKEDLKGITTRSGTAYQGPTIPTTFSSLPQVVECETEVTKDTMQPTNNESTKNVQPLVVQIETSMLNSEPVVTPIIEPVVAPVNALILMPKFGPSIKSLLTNKDKLYDLARTPLNEHCSTVLLKKLPEKLGDPGKFLIPCDILGMDECLALADLDASINLMPLSVWNKRSLPELSPTCMTFELADHSISRPVGVAEDVFVKVGTSSFLKTGRALIDVFERELTLRVGKEAITFNLDQTSRYSSNYNDMTANRIDAIDMAYES